VANLFRFSKKSNAVQMQNEAVRLAMRRGELPFDPQLVASLKNEHNAVLQIFNKIQHAMQVKDYGKIKPLFMDFKTGLTSHLLKENTRFYPFLEKRLDGDNKDLMVEMRKDMSGIGKTVMEFLRKYTEGGVSQIRADVLQKELNELGAILMKRIEQEENDLYPLYLMQNQDHY